MIRLPKIGIFQDKYKIGYDEGFAEGHLQAKKEMQEKIREIDSRLDGMRARVAVAEHQIILLEGLVRRFSEDQSRAAKEVEGALSQVDTMSSTLHLSGKKFLKPMAP